MQTISYMELEGEGAPKTPADETWAFSRGMSSSIFTDLFAGQLQSSLQCPHAECGNFSHTFSEVYDLSLPLALESSPGSGCSIQDCLDLFVKTETLDEEEGYNCQACGQEKVCATKKLMINRCPRVLVLHLKRFSPVGGTFIKDDTAVDVGTDLLDLTPFCSAAAVVQAVKSGQQLSYKLTAIVDHSGCLEGGHYTARCRADQRWLNYDDSTVTEELCVEGRSRAAYLLFYTQQDVVTEADRSKSL